MSFKLKGEVLGLKNVDKRLSDYSKVVQKDAGIAIAEGVLAIHAEAIKSIQKQGSSSGSETRYDPKRTVKVSAPGSPPNSDTGRLVKSIEFDIDIDKASGLVGTNLPYGAHLEFGAKSINLEARPWLAPAYRKFRDKIIKNLAKVLKSK